MEFTPGGKNSKQEEAEKKKLADWNRNVKGPIDGLTDYYVPPANPKTSEEGGMGGQGGGESSTQK